MDQLEKVEKLREKTGVSYEDAKNALEACGYDLLDAIVYLEKLGKVKAPEVSSYSTSPQEHSAKMVQAQDAYEQSCKKKTFGEHMDDFFHFLGDLIKKGCEKNFIIERKGERFMRMPVIVFILLLIFAFWVTLPLMIIGMFCDCKYHFEGDTKTVQDINHACDKVSEACETLKDDVKKE